ncbi:aldose epimerase family protein [Xinfangfangia pollutisoli]|uniref:aldose epimerase family protein n=1 Tax=Xinfangfangia pollutisoli TaxID=2865960 RepID=UPI001CD66C01|nr:aldose epimerase family protein [Xinfangfangia pollutisoli]
MSHGIGRIDGEEVTEVTLTGSAGLTAKVLTWGARLAELWVPDREGEFADIVLGHDTAADWQATPAYFGATCGRYANRIAGGRFALDGQAVQLDCNEGANHLHGGRAGIDRKHWRIVEAAADRVTLDAQSPAGEMGYPGALRMTCRYRIDPQDRLWIEMEAQTDAPTVVNLVNHAYFNMAGQGAGDVLAQELQLWADRYTPVGPGLIPTGDVLPVAGTPFDFTRPRAIGAALPGPGGFDHNFCLSAPVQDLAGQALRPTALARDPTSGRRMQIWSNAPGLQFYTGGALPEGLAGKDGARYGRFSGFALETQRWPDSPNHPGFPSARLDPGETYRHVMVFSFAAQD